MKIAKYFSIFRKDRSRTKCISLVFTSFCNEWFSYLSLICRWILFLQVECILSKSPLSKIDLIVSISRKSIDRCSNSRIWLTECLAKGINLSKYEYNLKSIIGFIYEVLKLHILLDMTHSPYIGTDTKPSDLSEYRRSSIRESYISAYPVYIRIDLLSSYWCCEWYGKWKCEWRGGARESSEYFEAGIIVARSFGKCRSKFKEDIDELFLFYFSNSIPYSLYIFRSIGREVIGDLRCSGYIIFCYCCKYCEFEVRSTFGRSDEFECTEYFGSITFRKFYHCDFHAIHATPIIYIIEGFCYKCPRSYRDIRIIDDSTIEWKSLT